MNANGDAILLPMLREAALSGGTRVRVIAEVAYTRNPVMYVVRLPSGAYAEIPEPRLKFISHSTEAAS